MLINITFVKISLTYLIKPTYLFVFNFNAKTVIIFYTKTVKTFDFSTKLFIKYVKNVLNFLTERNRIFTLPLFH